MMHDALIVDHLMDHLLLLYNIVIHDYGYEDDDGDDDDCLLQFVFVSVVLLLLHLSIGIEFLMSNQHTHLDLHIC